jgi:hypothetical protein
MPVQLRISGNYSETIQFLLITSPHVPVVLGFSWLQKHNPVIDWTTSSILGWSPFCHSHCLQAVQPSPSRLPQDVSKTVDVSAIPTEYHDLLEVFSKACATSLSLHRPYDCAIDLLPGTTPTRGQLYSLSGPETKAMEEYIEESPTTGAVRPFASPAGAGFFFVEKKDKTLRPCIDYRGLNDIPVKNRYPLPLLFSAFEPFQGATIFSKLDLRNAYHLVRMRREMSGRQPSTQPVGIMSTWSCHLDSPMPPLFSRLWSLMLNRFVFVYLDDILFFSPICTRTCPSCQTGPSVPPGEPTVHESREV